MSRRWCLGVMIDTCLGIYVQTRKHTVGPSVDTKVRQSIILIARPDLPQMSSLQKTGQNMSGTRYHLFTSQYAYPSLPPKIYQDGDKSKK
ncbi:hypothetical protein ACTXT7_016177 [Hymenolepis weldensis]